MYSSSRNCINEIENNHSNYKQLELTTKYEKYSFEKKTNNTTEKINYEVHSLKKETG